MDQGRVLSLLQRVNRAFKKFWREHIIDDDPYDALENQRFEEIVRLLEAQKRSANDRKRVAA